MEQLDLSLYSPKRPQIDKVRYSHDAMIDMVVAEPWITQNEIAIRFGRTAPWISTIFASDAFQARLAARKDDLVDPVLRASIEERMKGLVLQSIEVLQKRLETDASGELALGTLNAASKALGYGARVAPTVQVQNFVVHVPPKSVDGKTWEAEQALISASAASEKSERLASAASKAASLPLAERVE